jgi:hypothetical protein
MGSVFFQIAHRGGFGRFLLTLLCNADIFRRVRPQEPPPLLQIGRIMDHFENDSAAARITSTHFQLDAGDDVLEMWAGTATQSHKNAVYRSLFAMLEGSLLRTHNVVDDHQTPSEFFVVLKEDLVLKLRLNGFASFAIVYIGTWDDAPGVGTRG